MSDTAFDFWKALVDEELLSLIDCDSEQLPDQTYRDWYEAGWTPDKAAQETVRLAWS